MVVELTVALVVSVLGVVISVVSFVLSRKDKANKDVQEEQKQFSKHDLIEYRLDKIEKQLDKILNKLETYEKEVDDKIDKAFVNHIKTYHS